MQTVPDFTAPEIAAVFAKYPNALRSKLLFLRQLIFETAAETEGVGALEEGLRWGQPSYLTTRPKSGSTIRIDADDVDEGRYGVYFHCQTKLVATFREQYPSTFKFSGNRAILFERDDEVPVEELKHCIAQALTYHRWK